jgi:hypothetical protein
MYMVDELDAVVPLEGLPRWDTGAPMPLVLANEFTAVVAYMVPDASLEAIEPLIDGSPEDGEAMALVRFVGCRAHMLGAPNDEALRGHPLASRGLQPYGAHRVRNSSWLRSLERMNAVHPHHRPELFHGYEHFVLTFHDSTFECIARRAEAIPRYARTRLVVPRMAETLATGQAAG